MNNYLERLCFCLKPSLFLLVLAWVTPLAHAQNQIQPDEYAVTSAIIKRDIADGRIRLLNITTNFYLPYSSVQYFARLYYFPKNVEEVEFRDEQIAENHFDQEKKLKSPINYIAYESAQFKPPTGLDLVVAPGTLVNLTSEGNFSLKKGGYLTLYVKVPLQGPMRIRVLVENGSHRIRTSMFNQAGEKIIFDQIQIDAKTLFGRANIMRGISNITFLKAGKVVSNLYD